jgi:uncharacterized RDD family membrane protein YckC
MGHHDEVNQPPERADAATAQPADQASEQRPDSQAAVGAGGPAQPWMPEGPSGAPAYVAPGSRAYPGYGSPGSQAYPPPDGQSDGAPGGQANPQPGSQPDPGYGPPGGQPYSAPGNQGYPGYGGPGGQGYHPGYGPTGQGYHPGYSGPGDQGYHPGYGATGQGYPSYPPQPGYGQYPGYGYRGKDPALAEWWQRLLARIIDWVILGVVFSPLWYPPVHSLLQKVQNISNQYPGSLSTSTRAQNAIVHAETQFFGRIVLVLVAFYLVTFLYDWVQHAVWGQTIGKRALGTMVVTADGHAKITSGSACGRAAVYALPGLVPFVGGLFSLLNELWLLWDGRRQCLHDKAAHTVVIKKNYQDATPAQAGGWQ